MDVVGPQPIGTAQTFTNVVRSDVNVPEGYKLARQLNKAGSVPPIPTNYIIPNPVINHQEEVPWEQLTSRQAKKKKIPSASKK